MFDHPDKIARSEYAELGDALIEMDQKQAATVVPKMHVLVQQTAGDNYARIPAVRALRKTSESEVPLALQVVKPLSDADMNFQIRAMALREVLECEPHFSREKLNALVTLLITANSDVRSTVFMCLRELGKDHADEILDSAPAMAAKADELAKPGTDVSLEHSVSRATAISLKKVVSAGNEADFKRAAAAVPDFLINDRRDVEVFSYIGAVKLAGFLRHQQNTPDLDSSVNHLLSEMRSPLAERWALYRQACARAIALCAPRESHPRLANRLRKLWAKENCPHIRIALALSIEELR
jgi:HEAT repeat protein